MFIQVEPEVKLVSFYFEQMTQEEYLLPFPSETVQIGAIYINKSTE